MKRIKVLYLSSGSSIHTIRWVNSLSKRSDLIVNLVSQQKLIDMSEGCDGILSALTDNLDEKTINKLPI